jgi:hypothetical protein
MILQWYQREDNSWEDEKLISDSIVFPKFWKEFIGGKHSLKEEETKRASDEIIRMFFFQPVATLLSYQS